ncbi:8799_t:CDS:2, partial [Gigaspora rosea]
KKKTPKADISKAAVANLRIETQDKERKHHRTLHAMESDRSKTSIKNISVHSMKWNPKHEEVSGSTNEEIEETPLPCSGQRKGGSPTLLKVATGVNKGFCETEVSQARKMRQNKKGQYSTIGIE